MSITIYYMRDNHTFKKLSEDVSTALIEIEHEFNEGYTFGALCSKGDGFPMVHANGSKNRLEFFADCKVVLEKWLPKATPSQPEQEPVAWADLRKEAQQIVESKFLWKKFIDGTPLSNDIACWMAEFAQQYATPPQRTWVGLTEEQFDQCDAHDPWRSMRNVAAMLKELNHG